MFGSEGERLQQLRQQQAQEYALELRRQIAERQNRKPTTPAMYSTTNNDAYHGPVQPQRNANPQPAQFRNIQQNPVVISPRRFSGVKSPGLSPRYREPIPDFNPTAIAPLNLAISSFQPDPTPSLPRQQTHKAAVDDSTFSERIRSLEALLDQHRSMLTESSDANTRIMQHEFPDVNTSMEELKSRVDRMLSVDITSMTRPISEGAEINRESIESTGREMKSGMEDMRESLNEIGADLPQFMTKFNDIADFAKGSIIETKSDVARARDLQELSMNRITQVENRESLINELSAQHSGSFESADTNVSDSFKDMQQTIGSLMLNVSRQLAREISEEGTARSSTASILESQAAEINHRAGEGMTNLHKLANEMMTSFKDTTQNLSTSVSEALTEAQEELESVTTDLGDRLDSLIAEAESNFKAIQTETVSTIEALKGNVAQTRNSMEDAITTEMNTRARNSVEILNKYASFGNLVMREIEVQSERAEEFAKETRTEGIRELNRSLQPALTDLTVLREQAKKIETSEATIDRMENQFRVANAQVQEALASLTNNFNQVSRKFDEARSSIASEMTDYERRLTEYENDPDRLAYEQRDVMLRLSKDMDDLVEQRVQEVERQISVVLRQLAELTMQNARRKEQVKTAQESPYAELQRLVEEAEFFPADFDCVSKSATESETATGHVSPRETEDSNEKEESEGELDEEVRNVVMEVAAAIEKQNVDNREELPCDPSE